MQGINPYSSRYYNEFLKKEAPLSGTGLQGQNLRGQQEKEAHLLDFDVKSKKRLKKQVPCLHNIFPTSMLCKPNDCPADMARCVHLLTIFRAAAISRLSTLFIVQKK